MLIQTIYTFYINITVYMVCISIYQLKVTVLDLMNKFLLDERDYYAILFPDSQDYMGMNGETGRNAFLKSLQVTMKSRKKSTKIRCCIHAYGLKLCRVSEFPAELHRSYKS